MAQVDYQRGTGMIVEPDKRRKFTRIHFDRLVNFVFTDNSYDHCRIQNLSISGMFAIGTFQQQIGENCHIDLVQKGISTNLTLRTSAKVVWTNDEGIAIEFTSMTFDSYMFLQVALLSEVEDPLPLVIELPEKCPFEIIDQEAII